jgi:hypothetical protein
MERTSKAPSRCNASEASSTPPAGETERPSLQARPLTPWGPDIARRSVMRLDATGACRHIMLHRVQSNEGVTAEAVFCKHGCNMWKWRLDHTMNTALPAPEALEKTHQSLHLAKPTKPSHFQGMWYDSAWVTMWRKRCLSTPRPWGCALYQHNFFSRLARFQGGWGGGYQWMTR